TPMGRILNRFSRDVQQIDEELPNNLHNLLEMIVVSVASVIVISVVTWYLLLAVPVILLIYYRIQRLYRLSSREVKRLDSISRSPIFQSFSSTLLGLETIRAFESSKDLWEATVEQINDNMRPYLLR